MPVRERQAPDSEVPTPLDRVERDGDAGRGDMLGGLNAGAGDRLGHETADPREFEPGPISGCQHDLDDAEPRSDAATTYHGLDERR